LAFDHDVGVRVIKDAVRALARVGVTAWIQDGTLLGAVREGRPIEWDADLDLGVMSRDWNPRATASLKAAGFINTRNFNQPGSDYHQHWMRDGVKFDIFHYYTRPDGRVWHGLRNRNSRFVYEREFDIAPVLLSGIPFPAPDPPEAFLVTKYGPDWRTPKRQWNCARDPANTERVTS
jgi:hypothetical protein